MHDSRCSISHRLCLWLVLSVTGAARAGTEAEDAFDRHVRQATRLYKGQQYAQAVDELEAAYALRTLPRLQYNLGRACENLKRAQEAADHYERYLRMAAQVDPETRARLERYIEAQREPPPAPVPQAPPAPAVAQTPPAPAVPQAPPPSPRVTSAREPRPPSRPRWRLATGLSLTGAGLGLIAGGVPALAIDGHRMEVAGELRMVQHTLGLGLGLTISGAALSLAGVIIAALPGERRPIHAARPVGAYTGGK
jgi:tetratricopeptide (TPR) repeat protein